ncbi:MAG: hypothetical protein KKD44_13390 [Proteobacteria bacterium]|nr:hypothetical protein [Pseudomonadota bacterium]
MKKAVGIVLLALICVFIVHMPVAHADQPYSYNNGSYLLNAFQQQDDYNCGQTCMYIISRYYGDVGPEDAPHRYKIKKFYWWYTYNLSTYYMAKTYWVYYIIDGISIDIGLYFAESLNTLEKVPYYNERSYTSDYSSSGASSPLTTYDKTTTENENIKEDRLNYIRDNYFEDNIPVIVHLDRENQTGHYIILAGYENGIVYYVNPNDVNCPGGFEGDDTDIIHEVPVDVFLSPDWYDCGLDPATWDGKWFTYFHEKPFVR